MISLILLINTILVSTHAPAPVPIVIPNFSWFHGPIPLQPHSQSSFYLRPPHLGLKVSFPVFLGRAGVPIQLQH